MTAVSSGAGRIVAARSSRLGARAFSALRQHRFPLLLGALAALVTTAPYLFAWLAVSDDKRFVGFVLGVDDHAQYFTWMRDFTTGHVAANRLTPEPNAPVFFNLLWWTVGKALALTHLSLPAMYTVLRLVSIGVCVGGVYVFVRSVALREAERRTALFVSLFGSGMGFVWVAHKYLTGAEHALHPLDTHTAEPNTFLIMLGFPHFTIALGLLALCFAFVLTALRSGSYVYGALAGGTALVLGLQHAYDLITLYAVLGAIGLLVWLRDRRFPTFIVKVSALIAALSAPPALYSLWLVTTDPVWSGVLDQFGDAGVFTPSLPHLLVLLGAPFALALLGFRGRDLQSADVGDLMVAAWFVAHLPLVYLPVDFQIHLLLGWQIPIAILAARGLHRVVLPFVGRRSARLRQVVLASALLLVVATNAYLLAWRFVELRREEEPYFLSSAEYGALLWLDAHATRDDVVFADVEFGRFVPMMSDARSFIGHWANTLDYRGKRQTVQFALDPSTSASQRDAIFSRYGVTYVVTHGPAQSSVTFPGSTVVYQSGSVTVYRVQEGR